MFGSVVTIRVACWLMHSSPKAGHHHMAMDTIGSTPTIVSTCSRVGKLCEQHYFSTSIATSALLIGILFVGRI